MPLEIRLTVVHRHTVLGIAHQHGALAQKGDRFAAAAQLTEALKLNPSVEEAGKIQELLARIEP